MDLNKPDSETTGKDQQKLLLTGLCLLLIGGIVAVYSRVAGFDFLDYDDPFYVTRNPHVLTGLTWAGVKWAFTTMHAGNWFPFVWLSLMLDRTLFGSSAAVFHLVNVAFHIANTILLFLVFKRYTKSIWPSFFAAAAFALHPLHVESVAWITERKDVLSTLFWLLTMLAYIRYVKIPSARRYVIVCLAFTLGLMSKSMLVTLPLVLILLDYWPLNRLNSKFSFLNSFCEKIPLLILSVVVSVVTVIAQKSAGAVSRIEAVPFGQRFGNALVSYCDYILKMFWPVELAVYYPHPIKSLVFWKIAAALAVLLAISITVILLRNRRYLLVGWLWYLGTLLPVIGLVQVGSQAMADRYTYIPLTGIFIMLIWLVKDIVGQHRLRQIIAGLAGSGILCALGVISFVQVGYWRDTITLFKHCEAMTPDNVVVHMYLGTGFAHKGDAESALQEFEKALKFEPNETRTFYNIGLMLVSLGRIDEAVEYFNRILEVKPGDTDACLSLASAWAAKGEFERAIDVYRNGLKYNPNDTALREALALLLLQLHRVDEAITELEQAVKIKPDSASYCNLGIAWGQKGQIDKAAEYYTKSIQIEPGNAKAHYNLGNLYLAQQKLNKAIVEYREAIRAMPDYVLAHNMLASVLLQTGQIDEAVMEFQQAVKIDPNNKDAQAGLKKARAMQTGKTTP